jgi:hypothetical protein
MTTLLHIEARPDAPVACDMTTAVDTPTQRLGDYGRLFERALLDRERRDGAVVLRLRGDSDTRAAVLDLARREAACCPFLGYRVETAGDAVIWTIAGDGRPEVDAILDAFHALPDGSGAEELLGAG